MSDSQSPAAPVDPRAATSPSEQAVTYILDRVVSDRNFSWLMWGTEAMNRCLVAEAARRGISPQEVDAELVARTKAEDAQLRHTGRNIAEVRVLRKRLELIENFLYETLRHEIEDGTVYALRRLIEGNIDV